jgi:hypothetical protein
MSKNIICLIYLCASYDYENKQISENNSDGVVFVIET